MRINPADLPLKNQLRFGSNPNTVRVITIPLDDQLTERKFDVGGTIIWCMASADNNNYADIRFGSVTSDQIRIRRGMSISGVEFDTLYVSAPAQPGGYLTLFVSVETNERIRVDNAVADYSTVQIDVPDLFSSTNNIACNPTASTAIIGAQTDVETRYIQSLYDNIYPLYLTDNTGTVPQGICLQPGDCIPLRCKGALYIYNAASITQYVGIAYTKFS